jgi:Domain of unknown function (DUF4032)
MINQVDQDFRDARFRAFLNAIRGALRQQPTTLLPFEEVRGRVFIRGQRDAGFQTVPLDRIVGSEGRYTDFDRLFLPLSDRTRDRWKSISRAQYQEIPLPPVELYQIGQIYFVRDGNHRISVARQRGQVDIDAHVIELKTDVPLTPELDQRDLLLKEEQSDFLEWTNLAQLRPGASIEISELGGYLDLTRHIEGHRYFLSLERGQEVSAEEAITHWYDTVYLPLIAAIRRSGIVEAFGGRTEADLYLWIMDHRHYLTEQAGHDPGADAAVRDYTSRFGPAKARWQIKKHPISPQEQRFLEASGLERSRPGLAITLSDPADYETLWRHIRDHQYYQGRELLREVALPEAAASWYDRVYQPVIRALERQGTLDHFPNQTPADLYLLVMNHLSYLQAQGVTIDITGAAEDYAARFDTAQTTLLAGALFHARRLLGRVLYARPA